MRKKTVPPGLKEGPPREPSSFPLRRMEFIDKNKLVRVLAESGVSPPDYLLAQLKTPQSMSRGKYENLEFYDVLSTQPISYTGSDSPSKCFDQKKSAPVWINKWYLAIVEEEGQKFLVFAYVPKKVFTKCRLEDAETHIPAIMQKQTIAPD